MNIGKDKIISAAVELFREKGYTATSVKDIADKLGVTKAGLYYYVQSKEEILWEIFDKTMTTFEQRMEQFAQKSLPVKDYIRAIVHNHILNVRDEAPYMTIFFTEMAHLPADKQAGINNRREKYEKKIVEIFKQGIHEGILKPLPVLPTVYGLLGMCNWIYQWYNPDGKLNPKEIADIYSEVLLNGISKCDS